MATRPCEPALLREAYDAWQAEGGASRHGSKKRAAKRLGVADSTFKDRLDAYQRTAGVDPAILDSMVATNTNMIPQLAWVKTRSEDGIAYSVLLKPDVQGDVLDRIRDAFTDVPTAPAVAAPTYSDADLLTVYPLADAHVGMLAWGRETGEDYDTAIACGRIREWIGRCVAASPPARTAVILDVGDLTHADDQTNQTPKSRHVLDVDTRHFRTLDMTIAALAAGVDLALAKHERVIVRILPGNHNPTAYLAVMFALAERYRSEERVEIVKDPSEFFVLEWGKVMLAAHHGDKAKAQRMTLWLADEHAEMWGRTRHRFLFTGHMHSHKSEDIGGLTWEQLRAVTARDAYSASNAYVARSQLQGITYHRERGEVQRVKIGN